MDLSGTDTLNVDLSSYDLSNGDLTIFTYGSLQGSAGSDIFDTLNITGGTADFVDDAGNNRIILTNITTAVPEPGSAIALGMLAVGMFTRRRR